MLLSQEGGKSGRPSLNGPLQDHSRPLAEEIQASNPGILAPLYADDVAFDVLEQRSAQFLKLLMERGSDRGISQSWTSHCLLRIFRSRSRRRRGSF